ncbi:MAG: hypothetical protein ACKO37_08705 [Vampirovibrionales bacterium]
MASRDMYQGVGSVGGEYPRSSVGDALVASRDVYQGVGSVGVVIPEVL